MSEPLSDALFGVNGTELPELLPDPSGRGGWRGEPELPPLTLPAVPDVSVLREAMAGALGDGSTGPVDQDPGAVPGPQPVSAQNVAAPLPTTPAPPAAGVPVAAGVPTVVVVPTVAEVPTAVAPGRRPSRPLVPASVQPAKPPPRKPGGLGYRPPLATAALVPGRLVDLRRRGGPQRNRPRRQIRSNGGAGVVLVVGLIIVGVLVFNIIAGIVESVSRLIP